MKNELNDTRRKEDSVQVSCKQMVEVTTSGTTNKESDTTSNTSDNNMKKTFIPAKNF